MDSHALSPVTRQSGALTRRDLVRPVFRHRRIVFGVVLAVASLAALATLAWPAKYEAEMKILVKRDRVEPLMTPEREAGAIGRPEVRDSDIYSAVALLRSRDLLRDVARAAGLVEGSGSAATSAAVVRLEKDLEVTPIRRTALIVVTYGASDPERARSVLSHLSRLYLEKHLAVHRAPGAHEFFRQQADRVRGELQAAQTALLAFGKQHGVVSAADERASALQRLAEFEGTLQQVRAQIADADRRLAGLRDQLKTTPPRLPTLQRRQDNGPLVADLTARVLELDIKRTEMLRKFNPTYPPVVELEQQLAQARTALAAAERSPITDEATDQNPTYQWLRNEEARVQAEREGLQARVAATLGSIRQFQEKARLLDERGAEQQDLLRVVKAAEENYQLYERKAEETRVSEALDDRRIANVSVAEAPTLPARPATNRLLILAAGLFAALVAGLATAFLVEYLNPRFRTRDEVEAVLDLPVLAAIPEGTR